MPEGDAIFRAAQSLHRALAGRTVTRFQTAQAGVHPETPSSAVPHATLERMMDIARGVLKDHVIDGTSPRIQTYRNLRQLNPASEHDESVWVYGRRGKPCRTCGTPIAMKKSGLEARSTYWCPRCQRISRLSTAD